MRSGYIFRVFLPGPHGRPIGESGTLPTNIEPRLAEQMMAAVAWPAKRGKTGTRAFLVNASGDIYYCADGPYGGRNAPEPEDLSAPPSPPGRRARDGNHWWRLQ